MDYYRDHYMNDEGKWLSNPGSYYKLNGSNFAWAAGQRTTLTGPQQEWAYLSHPNNNPYWLINSGNSQQKESRLFGTLQANVDIYDGLTFQARVNYSQIRFRIMQLALLPPSSLHLWKTTVVFGIQTRRQPSSILTTSCLTTRLSVTTLCLLQQVRRSHNKG